MKKTVLTVVAILALTTTSAIAANVTPVNSNFGIIEASTKVEASTFCKAIMQGDIETVKKLIELGEDVNQKSLGMTPAIFAARYNKAEILKVLINHGADLSVRSNKGWGIEKYAKLSNAKEVLAVLNTQT